MKKFVVFAPFWRLDGHVGKYRVGRFLQWLVEEGYRVVLIRAGSDNSQHEKPWGTEISVRDPMGLYRDPSPSDVLPKMRKLNMRRRALAYRLFNPDPSIVWACKAALNYEVQKAATDASFILSSSPPESAHIGAWKLSRKLGLAHIVDMRDGWLDEPIKPLLRTSSFRRWQECRLERRTLHDASAILVTSAVWRELLCNRLPFLAKKVTVLTNSYPLLKPKTTNKISNNYDKDLLLVHGGRFLGSRMTQSPELLLRPLLDGIECQNKRGVVKLIGTLTTEELEIIKRLIAPFDDQDWRIECPGKLPRKDLLKLLPEADGLLLLSESYAAIPCKLFEYIPTRRPIFVVTMRDSATWRICTSLPQAILVESNPNQKNDYGVIAESFLRKAGSSNFASAIPNQYSEDSLKLAFAGVISRINKMEVSQ